MSGAFDIAKNSVVVPVGNTDSVSAGTVASQQTPQFFVMGNYWY